MERASLGGFILHIVVLLLMFLSFVRIVFELSGTMLRLELLIVLGLLLLAVIGMWWYTSYGRSSALMFVYAVSVLNVIVLFVSVGRLEVMPLVLGAVGVFLSMVLRGPANVTHENEPWATSEVNVEEIEPETLYEEVTTVPVKKSKKTKVKSKKRSDK
jgi:cation transport ATPase